MTLPGANRIVELCRDEQAGHDSGSELWDIDRRSKARISLVKMRGVPYAHILTFSQGSHALSLTYTR